MTMMRVHIFIFFLILGNFQLFSIEYGVGCAFVIHGLYYVEVYPLWEKAMAPHSSTVARKIPRMEEPGRLQFIGSLRVKHD